MDNYIKLIVGLGNYGAEYAKTRHNAGFWFVEKLLSLQQTTPTLEAKFKGLFAKVNFSLKSSSIPILILMPSTYMNLSGQAVQSVCNFYHIEPKEILVIHDDLDLPAGTIRFKCSGGHAGHNGLRSIFDHLHSQDFYRLRIGIGHPLNKALVSDYVLTKPSSSDRELIDLAIEKGLSQIINIISGNIATTKQMLHQ